MIVVAIIGGLLLAGSAAGARLPEIHPLERRVFRFVNRLPDWLYLPLWLPMQLGNLIAGTAAGLAIAAWYRNWLMAAGVVVAAALKLVAERVVRGAPPTTSLSGSARARASRARSGAGAMCRPPGPASPPAT